MKFCPQCGKRLILVVPRDKMITCFQCGTTVPPANIPVRFGEKSVEDVVIIEQAEHSLVQSMIKAHCPKCGGYKAYFRIAEIGDEESTVGVGVFRCAQCKHTWRERR